MADIISPAFSSEIWRILYEECGNAGDKHDEYNFQHYLATASKFHYEWRFQGNLGFGGKFINDGKWHVTCYHEDRTPERDAAMTRANARLIDLYRKYLNDS